MALFYCLRFLALKIVPLSLLFNNYCYVVIDKNTSDAVLIDPSDPEVVQLYLQENNIIPKAILTTHKHW